MKTYDWEELQTVDSEQVANLLRAHFEQVHAYRYNTASIRVRIVDSRFEDLSREQRYDLVEPILDELDESIQSDIMNIVLLYPGEVELDSRAMIRNVEFEHPIKSML